MGLGFLLSRSVSLHCSKRRQDGRKALGRSVSLCCHDEVKGVTIQVERGEIEGVVNWKSTRQRKCPPEAINIMNQDGQ